MIFRRFFYDKLAQASYLVGADGEALVVDPNRDVEFYVGEARQSGLRIAHVAETHIHADFLSGARELARRTGAQLHLSDEGPSDWRYGYAREERALLHRQGDQFMVGSVRIEVAHTPGHTPEHLSFLLADLAVSQQPMGVFSGDFLFVGSVGRPDLLERAVQQKGTMEASARTLYQSLRRFRERPDWLQVWPAHGAGSACGKGLSAVPQSTLGYEKLTNPWLAHETEEGFVRAILDGQPDPPRYFALMKRLNRDGPPLRGGPAAPAPLPAERLPAVLQRGGIVVDVRPAAQYAQGFLPGTINLPLDRSFPTWAGWLLPPDADLHLLAPAGQAAEAARDLAMIGLDRVAGVFGADALESWAARGGQLATIRQVRAGDLARELHGGGPAVLDVRWEAEWRAGHLPGVPNVPLGQLLERLSEVPSDRPLVVHCQGGGRSSIAASLLHARGFRNVTNLIGGFAEWQAGGHPVER
jgi:hydroxyacylglutathione hydrolase